MNRAILISCVVLCLAGCRRQAPAIRTAPVAPQVLKQEWTSAQPSILGKSFREVATALGPMTCGDNQVDPNYPDEVIYTFTHDGMDYRVHFKNEESIRAFKAKPLMPDLR